VINRDFSDIRSIMLGMGFAMMGAGSARGEGAVIEAARQAISCPMLDDGGVKGAKGILINITGSSQMGLHEINDACQLVRAAAEYEDVQVNFGLVLDESLGDEVKFSVIATGFQRAGIPSFDRKSPLDEVPSRAMTSPEFEEEPEPAIAAAAASAPVAAAPPQEEPKDDRL
jgi:cell division protein FtsZ